MTVTYVHVTFVLSQGEADTALAVELPAEDGVTDADCLAVIGVKDADCGGVVDAAADPATSARKRRRKACGVPTEPTAGADSCGEGLTLGVVLRELLKSHWSTSWTSSLGVGPPSSSLASTQDRLPALTTTDHISRMTNYRIGLYRKPHWSQRTAHKRYKIENDRYAPRQDQQNVK